MRPKTLLELAGLSPAPSPLSQAALVVIDAQREYVDGRLPLPGVQAALGEIAALLARARRAGAPIIHVRAAPSAPTRRALPSPPKPRPGRASA